MVSDLSIIISSCEKFSDLWDEHFKLLFKHWKGDLPPVYLVTDMDTQFTHFGVNVVDIKGNMPVRLKYICSIIDTKYALITLDDYFVISDVYENKINRLMELVKENGIDFLRIYDRQYCKQIYYTDVENIKKIDLSQKYAVSLYPAIWNKEFFEFCVEEDDSPWNFEPRLTQKAIEFNANCYYNNSGSFEILDVVRKGHVLHKANRYFKKNNIDIGDRPLTSWSVEIKQYVADFIWWYMPRWVYKLTRRLGTLFGMKFFSEE